MPHGDLVARHYRTGQPVQLTWQTGRITGIHPIAQQAEAWLAPSLLDLQINGYAGVDFQQDQLTTQDLLQATRGLQSSGCARFFLTLMTDDWPRLLERLRHVRQLRHQRPELHRSIVGWHVEGPFLSPEPGFAGAHDPNSMCDPTPGHIQALRQAAGTDPLLLTLAPERPGAIPVIQEAAGLGVRVSLGHTDARAACLAQAVQAGATGFTHLGNGCPRLLDRHDNIIWRVLENLQLTVSLIPDGIHLPAPLFRIIHRMIPRERLYYTTDAMAAAGAPPGRYQLGKLQVEVGEDQVVRKPGSPLFAGSALQPCQGVFRAAEMLGCSWADCWHGMSEAPARLMGLPPPLETGQPATFCLLQIQSNQLRSLRLWIEGEERKM